MKGVVFTEFLEMIESKMGQDMADDLLDSCDLPSGGSYTALGTYDHTEIVQLVVRLSELTRTPVPALLKLFGSHLLGRFTVLYPAFFEQAPTLFQLLSKVEDYIHVEVRKLYPDAELPSFEIEQPGPQTLVMTYSSTRPFADLAEGLIQGCIAHYGNEVDMVREDLEGTPGTHARFALTLR
jgi:hypothetical protein